MSGPPLSHSATSDATVSKRGKRIFLYFISFIFWLCPSAVCVRLHYSVAHIDNDDWTFLWCMRHHANCGHSQKRGKGDNRWPLISLIVISLFFHPVVFFVTAVGVKKNGPLVRAVKKKKREDSRNGLWRLFRGTVGGGLFNFELKNAIRVRWTDDESHVERSAN